MNMVVATSQYEVESIPALIDRAAKDLVSARSAAEVLEAKDKASLAYDLAKKQARIEKAKNAHDTVVAAAHRAQARALEIESQAKIRLADEYDAAQERGEVAKRGEQDRVRDNVPAGNIIPATAADLGLTHKGIHDARQIRDAERVDPGVVSRSINTRLDCGEEPSRAALRKSVIDAATNALRGHDVRQDRRNPHYVPNPDYDAAASLAGSCRRINELIDQRGPAILNGCLDDAMRARHVAILIKCRDQINKVLEAENV